MIPHFKNSVICKGAYIICGDGFQNTKITLQSNKEEKEMEMKGTPIYPKPLVKGSSMRKIC